MGKSNNLSPQTHSVSCLLDSDVIINWLTKEKGSIPYKTLWEAPHKIIKLIEEGKIKGFSTLINLLEIRFVLRRKKNFSEDKIKEDIAKILKLLEIIVPDEVNLLKANNLQDKLPLDPFDAILLAAASAEENIVLVTRDKALISLASKLLEASTPEKFIENTFPCKSF